LKFILDIVISDNGIGIDPTKKQFLILQKKELSKGTLGEVGTGYGLLLAWQKKL